MPVNGTKALTFSVHEPAGLLMNATASSTGFVNVSTSALHVEDPIQPSVVPCSSPLASSYPLMGKTPVSIATMFPWLDLYPEKDAAEL